MLCGKLAEWKSPHESGTVVLSFLEVAVPAPLSEERYGTPGRTVVLCTDEAAAALCGPATDIACDEDRSMV
jgi:hypothetical protein